MKLFDRMENIISNMYIISQSKDNRNDDQISRKTFIFLGKNYRIYCMKIYFQKTFFM